MFNSHGHRKLWLAAAGAVLLTVAGCSNQATNEATDTAKKAETGKSGAVSGKATSSTAKKTQNGKTGAVSSKVKVSTAKKAPTGKSGAVSSKAAQQSTLITVPKGTAISATVGQTLASNKNHAGDSFTASLSTPVKVGGKTVIPKGAHVVGRVVTAKKRRPAELTVTLASVEVRGKSYPLETNSIAQSGKNPAKQNVKDSDTAKAKEKKDVTVPADSNLKFKLAKSVTIPAKG